MQKKEDKKLMNRNTKLKICTTRQWTFSYLLTLKYYKFMNWINRTELGPQVPKTHIDFSVPSGSHGPVGNIYCMQNSNAVRKYLWWKNRHRFHLHACRNSLISTFLIVRDAHTYNTLGEVDQMAVIRCVQLFGGSPFLNLSCERSCLP